MRAVVNVAMICETNINSSSTSSSQKISTSSNNSIIERSNLVCKITYVAFSKIF